jgi:hypothetical protein
MELSEKVLWSLSRLAGELGTVVLELVESDRSNSGTLVAIVGSGLFMTFRPGAAITMR